MLPDRDYISPGLAVVTPDAAFPHMRAGDRGNHPWKYLRREVPHTWYADERYPLMGFMNRDEAVLLHNIALQFRGKRALEIGSWLGWSTCHLALAGVHVDVIDPAHDDPQFRAIVEESVARCGVEDLVRLAGGRSPESIAPFSSKWSLFFIDGDHDGTAPLRDALACIEYAEEECAFVFHDLASPDVAAAAIALKERGFNVVVFQTAQIMAMAWRGDVRPPPHIPDPEVAWQVPEHLLGLMTAPQPAKRRFHRNLWEEKHAAAETSKPSVCIVTNEVIGPFKNGGIGTAMTGLAETLAAGGLPVTILYTGAVWTPDVALTPWKRRYKERGIELVSLDIAQMAKLDGPVKDSGFGVPSLVYSYLATHPFDVVHFNDCCGDGALALSAKHLGIAFRDTLMVVAVHSPSQWVLELNHTIPASPLLAAFNHGERVSIRCADLVWSPSRYMLDWIAERDFELPPQTFVQQYAIPSPPAALPSRRSGEPLREIVFFGRLEERKGLRFFCNAIHALRNELAERGITVTFLGKPATFEGKGSLDYIQSRAESWRFPVKTLPGLGQPAALAYLASEARLAVMPSPVDNSPCTVYETLLHGIPFIAARTGGIPELIDPSDRARVLFEPSTDGLRARLLDAIENGTCQATPSVSQDVIRESWLAVHANWKAFLSNREQPPYRGRQLVVIVDHVPGANLEATLQSLQRCYALRLVVILNRGSEVPASELPIRNVDLRIEDAAAVARLLADFAGDAILLLHSGVTVNEGAILTMLRTLDDETIDAIAPAALVNDGAVCRLAAPLGGSASFSLFHGVTFTGGLLIRGARLLEVSHRHSLVAGSAFFGLADYCAAAGVEIWPWPEPAFEYAKGLDLAPRGATPARLAAYARSSPAERYYMLSIGSASANSHKRELAMALIDLGLGPVVRLGSWGLRHARGIRRTLRRASRKWLPRSEE